MNTKTSILLVEDHEIVRKGLCALIECEEHFTIVAETDNGLDAIRLAETLSPDVIVMDIALPMLNGLEASKNILAQNLDLKIIILSAYSDDGYIEKAMSIGVDGFITKQCSPELLVNAIDSVMKGDKIFSDKINNRLNHLKSSDNKGILSKRESQVLQLIAEGMANKVIAFNLETSYKTVEKHRQSIMNKLCIHDTAGLTRYAISEGIIECSVHNGVNKD
jgi:DNA-binding NarL/FixJ family response regulator